MERAQGDPVDREAIGGTVAEVKWKNEGSSDDNRLARQVGGD